MESLTIKDKYAIINNSSSKGVKEKYFIPSNRIWYKKDSSGVEEEISNLLKYSSIDDYVTYHSVLVNGSPFCSSISYLSSNEEEITIARIIEYMTGKKAADYVFSFREIKDRFNAVINLVQEYTNVDIYLYLKTLLYLDMLIGNADRHFNNMSLLYNIKESVYYPAPIFDNGEALDLENLEACGNFGGKHEYVLSCIGRINSPILFDYDKINTSNKVLQDQLLKYESTFRYYGKMPIKEYGRKLKLLSGSLLRDDSLDYVDLVERQFSF